MVVNKKQGVPVAPSMGSRTSSNQQLTRQKATTNSKQSPSAGPSTSSSLSSTLQRNKLKKHSKRTKSSSFKDKLVLIFLSLFTLYALTTCPSDYTLSNPVCRSLSQYRTHVLEPYVLPPIQKALSHPSLAPTISKLHAAERAVTPIVIRTHAVTRPYIAKITQITKVTTQATLTRTLLPIYRKYATPRIRLFQARVVDPYVAPLCRKAEVYANKTILTLHRVFVTVRPHVHAAYVRARPHLERAWDVARPHLFKAAERVAAALGLIMEKTAEARRQYVDPHVLRIWEKVVELSGTSSTVSVSTTVTPLATSTEVKEETKGTSGEAEPEATALSTLSSLSSASVSATSSTSDPSSETASPSVPDEPVVPTETSTQVPPVDQATLSSASSVIHASVPVASSVEAAAPSSIPSAETSLLSEISAKASSSVQSASSFVSASVVPTASSAQESSTPSAVSEASPVVEQAPAQPEAEAQAETTFEESDDLDFFFADIGFAEAEKTSSPDHDEDLELGSDDHISVVAETPAANSEEAKEARRIATANKRASIEARMEKWTADLQALVKRRAKEVRKELVRVRKGAVRGLFPDSGKGGNTDLEETLTHVKGEDVAGMLGRLEVEGDRLLKGLESYLKKEEKVLAGKDVDDRLKRWDVVVQRVEDRFTERMKEMQEKVHWWYLEVRELEVQEYRAAVAEVKSIAEKAQGDVGLDLAWLDDVTYQDWQKYHDFMRMYERFDEQIRLIQNGSHPSPPIDPLVPALDKLQGELDDLVGGFKGQVRSFGERMRSLLTPPTVNDPEVETPEEQEGEVSILPIDPLPTNPAESEFDPGNIVIGKSKEQVEQAIKAAQEIHEEL